MLPSFCLVGRLDAVEVIGASLKEMAGGAGTRRVAEGDRRAVRLYHGARLVAPPSANEPWGCSSLVGSALGVVCAGPVPVLQRNRRRWWRWSAWVPRCRSVAGVGLWAAVSLAVGGAWLSTTTDTPTTAGWEGSWMAGMACRQAQIPP